MPLDTPRNPPHNDQCLFESATNNFQTEAVRVHFNDFIDHVTDDSSGPFTKVTSFFDLIHNLIVPNFLTVFVFRGPRVSSAVQCKSYAYYIYVSTYRLARF